MAEDHTPEFHDRVALRAQELWDSEGRPDGKADEYWFRAEAELRKRIAPPAPGTPTSTLPLPIGIIALAVGIVLGRLAVR